MDAQRSVGEGFIIACDDVAEVIASGPRVEEAPGDGSDFVEETDRRSGLFAVDGAGSGEEPEMRVDIFRGTVGDAPVVQSISPRSAVAFREIRGYRACGSNDLIG